MQGQEVVTDRYFIYFEDSKTVTIERIGHDELLCFVVYIRNHNEIRIRRAKRTLQFDKIDGKKTIYQGRNQ